MLKEIIHGCYTAFGDCVTGYVSAYLLRHQLEKITKNKIKLSINWTNVNCPYIDPSHYNRNRLSLRMRASINCLFSGEDGTLMFSRYYQSPKMNYDIARKQYLFFITNQYLGRCFTDLSRDDIKKLTLEAYQHFWNNVLDQTKIKIPLESFNFEQVVVASIRAGDKHLINKESLSDEILNNYRLIDTLDYPKVILLGDIDNKILKESFQKISSKEVVLFNGEISHSSCGNPTQGVWDKIFTDLYIMLRSKAIIMMNNDSNFIRIVLFMKSSDQFIYAVQNDQLVLIPDSSTLFAKHYTF